MLCLEKMVNKLEKLQLPFFVSSPAFSLLLAASSGGCVLDVAVDDERIAMARRQLCNLQIVAAALNLL